MSTKKDIIADALLSIIERAQSGGPVTRIGLMAAGSELGSHELLNGAVLAQQNTPGLRVVAIGEKITGYDTLEWIETPDCEDDIAKALEAAIHSGQIAGAVALHYPFPIGVATIGRVVTPGRAKPMFIASCTGTTSAQRGEALLRNAIYGIATARACGIANPTVAFLNIDGAGPALRSLSRMIDSGYQATLGSSLRGDGGSLLRGNDLVTGAVDVLVCDSLTGNVLIKLFATFTSGGQYETTGWGYGPSTGEGWKNIVSIISRASGAPVIANALALTAQAANAGLPNLVADELKKARAAGLDEAIQSLMPKAAAEEDPVVKPAAIPVDAQIAGVDVLEMDNAAKALWKEGVYAEAAMGCTGPVIRIATADQTKAEKILKENGFI